MKPEPEKPISLTWRHKDCWKVYGTNFLIEVTRHESKPLYFNEGPNQWAVYAYIYPKHPRFSKFVPEKHWQEAINDLPLHGGCSYLHVHRSEKEVTSWQFGADYHHLHDEYFTKLKTREEATEVFEDAEKLFQSLQSEISQEKL